MYYNTKPRYNESVSVTIVMQKAPAVMVRSNHF